MKKRIFKTFLIFLAVGIIMELLLSFIFLEIVNFPAIAILAIFEASLYLIYCFIFSRKHVLTTLLIFLLLMIAILVILFANSGQSSKEFFMIDFIPFIIRVIYYQVASTIAQHQFNKLQNVSNI